MGLSEYTAARVVVHRFGQSPLRFGLYPAGDGAHGDLVSVAWGRGIGKGDHGAAGRLVFSLPGRTQGEVGPRRSAEQDAQPWLCVRAVLREAKVGRVDSGHGRQDDL